MNISEIALRVERLAELAEAGKGRRIFDEEAIQEGSLLAEALFKFVSQVRKEGL